MAAQVRGVGSRGINMDVQSVLLPAEEWSSGRNVRFDNNSVEKITCLLYTSPSPRDRQKSRMPSSA